MMDCKKALADPTVNGDLAKAIDWLRAKGIARANNQAKMSPYDKLAILYNLVRAMIG